MLEPGVSSVKKKKTTAGKAKAVPKLVLQSKQPKGKPAAKKKLGVKEAIVAFIVISAAIIIWQWNRSPVITPATSSGGAQKETAVAVKTAPGMETAAATATAPGAGMRAAAEAEGSSLIIADIRITPDQPLATDTLKAIVSLASGDATGITLAYQWKINEQSIFEATEQVLKDRPLKRRDRVSVVVTASRNGITGPPAESKPVLIHSLPPSLDMKIVTSQIRMGLPIEIQLTGAAPDGDKVVYALTPPLLEGMTIDGNTGKISWKPQRVSKGKLKFGAAATDSDGNKTIKVFELDMGIEQGP